MGKLRGVIIINRNLVNKVTENRKPARSSEVKVVVHRPPLQLAVQEGLVVAWNKKVNIVFKFDSQLSALGSCFTMSVTALKRISSASSVSLEKSDLPVKSTILLNCFNYLPSASLQSRTRLVFSTSCFQLFFTSRSIFLLAARSTFFTFLWCSSDQQLQVTKMKMTISKSKNMTLEVNAKVLQSNVP